MIRSQLSKADKTRLLNHLFGEDTKEAKKHIISSRVLYQMGLDEKTIQKLLKQFTHETTVSGRGKGSSKQKLTWWDRMTDW